MPNEKEYIEVNRQGGVYAKAESCKLISTISGQTLSGLLRAGDNLLYPGEFLERVGVDAREGIPTVKRGGDGECSTPGTRDNEGTVRSAPYWGQGPAYPEVQANGRGLIPIMEQVQDMVITFGLVDTSDLAVGDEVSVWDYDGGLSGGEPRWPGVRRVLGKKNTGWAVGVVEAIPATGKAKVRMYGNRPE